MVFVQYAVRTVKTTLRILYTTFPFTFSPALPLDPFISFVIMYTFAQIASKHPGGGEKSERVSEGESEVHKEPKSTARRSHSYFCDIYVPLASYTHVHHHVSCVYMRCARDDVLFYFGSFFSPHFSGNEAYGRGDGEGEIRWWKLCVGAHMI